MNKLTKFNLKDINIEKMVQHRPQNFLFLGLRIIRGLVYRKFGFYSLLKSTSDIAGLDIGKITLLPRVNCESKDFWNEKLCIDRDWSQFWRPKRYNFLQKLFFELTILDNIETYKDDRENAWSACQLNWLFFEVRSNNKSFSEARSVIENCCTFLLRNRDTWIYRTFTLSEVVSNIVKIQLYFGEKINLSNEAKGFLSEAVMHIAGSLEVYKISQKTSMNHTNNHVLANVRALYWATKIYRNEELRIIADYAFENWCLPLFNDGDLDEGSTTYHLVAAQCIFDISFFQGVESLPRVDRLVHRLKESGFLSANTFPVIGDISPDPSFPCIVNDAERVSDLISDHFAQIKNFKSIKGTDFQKSDFEFYDHGNWSLILHTRDSSKHIQHSHNDYGSPIIKYGNKIIFFDLGRTSYNKGSNYLSHQTSTFFHSVPQIDGLEQSPRRYRDLYFGNYLDTSVKDLGLDECNVAYLGSNEFVPICKKEFILFPNLLYGGSWIRTFSVNKFEPEEFIIDDLIELNMEKPVVFRKYVPQKALLSSSIVFQFYLNSFPTKPKMINIPNSEYYGHVSMANSFVVESGPAKSHRLITKVRIEDGPSNFYR